jgi:hypothetical protein
MAVLLHFWKYASYGSSDLFPLGRGASLLELNKLSEFSGNHRVASHSSQLRDVSGLTWFHSALVLIQSFLLCLINTLPLTTSRVYVSMKTGNTEFSNNFKNMGIPVTHEFRNSCRPHHIVRIFPWKFLETLFH